MLRMIGKEDVYLYRREGLQCYDIDWPEEGVRPIDIESRDVRQDSDLEQADEAREAGEEPPLLSLIESQKKGKKAVG